MITEDYVSFETAKLLKEKGFDECTLLSYDKNGNNKDALRPFLESEGDVRRPTLQMAIKWLRKVHKLHINLDIHWLYFANALGWMYTITKILENGVDYVCSNGDENNKTFYSSYEEVCEVAIKYCLENLI